MCHIIVIAPCITKKKNTCAFPFEFKSKKYFKCTEDGGYEDFPWCFDTRNTKSIPDGGKWGYCPSFQITKDPKCPGKYENYYIEFSLNR